MNLSLRKAHNTIRIGVGLLISALILAAGTAFINSMQPANATGHTNTVLKWSTQPAAGNGNWTSITWSPELGKFVAVGKTSSFPIATIRRIMTSTDGKNWNLVPSANLPATAGVFTSVTWSPELSLFVAVTCARSSLSTCSDGTNLLVMTSPTGDVWTERATPDTTSDWQSVTWSPELNLFVAVADAGGNCIMTSPDGTTWTARTAPEDNAWRSVTWSPELDLFVAVAGSGTNRVMTSPDGMTWTARSASEANTWVSVTWSPELNRFVAVSSDGTNRVMTSSNGTSWVAQSAAAANAWAAVTWSPGLQRFTTVANGGTNRVMTSPDGMTWTAQSASVDNSWNAITWSPALSTFVAVGGSGTFDIGTSTSARAMTGSMITAASNDATNVAMRGATLNGDYLDTFPGTNTFFTGSSVFFRYRLAGSSGSFTDTTPQAVSAQGAFSAIIAGLTPNTEYEFKAVVQWPGASGTQTLEGGLETFTTLPAAPGGVSSGLTAWQKANDGSASSTLWQDSSGNGNSATSGAASVQPTLVNSGINFNPAFNFDGSNDYFAYNNALGVGGTANFSSLVALRPDDFGVGYNVFGNNGGIGNNFLFVLNTSGAFGVGRGGNSSGPSCGATTTTTLPAGVPGVGSYTRLTGAQAKVELNGGGDHTGACATNFAGTNRLLGRRVQSAVSGGLFDGLMGEFIHYNRTLTDAELSRIQSYLAIKYGVTLDQATPQNYIASDGTTTPWNAVTNGIYKHNITGIGRDDDSDLNQKQSRSQNLQGIVTVGHGTVATDNVSNINDFVDNKDFLMFGDDNNSATTWADTGATTTTLTNYQRLPRTWKVQETGGVGNVTIALDTADPDADVPTAISNYYLLRDSDNDSSFADETPILMTNTGGGQFNASGVNFNDGELFTFATLANKYSVHIQAVDNLTGEDGDTGTFKVNLGARPSAAVTITLSSSNTDEGTVPASITIQPDDWDNFDANVVTVTGIDDTPPAGDGAVPYTIVTGDVTSADANFDVLGGSDVEDVAMFNQNNDPPGINVSLVAGNTTTETGGCATVRFVLLSLPTAAVTIPLSIDDAAEGTLNSVTQITIQPADWNQPQNNEVSICGMDDALTDGDILYQLITGDPTSGDGGYDALTGASIADVSLTNTDNDSPGVTVTETGGSTDTTEGGATDTFTVVLNTQPAPGDVVVINLQPDGQLNLGSGTATAIQLTFTNANWNVPQTVTVTANDDSAIENAHSGAIDISIHGGTTQLDYLGVNPSDVTVQITDNDEDDRDGVPPTEEDAAPNDGDANEDGTPDSQQPYVASFVNDVTGEYAVLEIDSTCQISAVSIAAETSNDIKDPGFDYPVGLMNFTADCGTPGHTATVTQYFYGATNEDFVLRKHNPNTNAYFTITGATLAQVTIGGETATATTYQITDGGTLDTDGSANGVVIDPAGLAQQLPAGDLAGTGSNQIILSFVTLFVIATSATIIISRIRASAHKPGSN